MRLLTLPLLCLLPLLALSSAPEGAAAEIDSPMFLTGHAGLSRTTRVDGDIPSPPTRAQIEILHRLRSDTFQGKLCPVRNSSRAHCRDPRSYVRTNEGRTFLFAPYIRGLRGGFAGVGADGSYTFVAHAKSEWVWLFDHDPTIVRLHFLLRAFILASPSSARFVARFRPGNKDRSVRLLRQYYHDGEALDEITYVYTKYRAELYEHYRTSVRPSKAFGDFGWLRNPQAYAYIRALYQQDRIALLYGDLLQTQAMQSIGESARGLGTSIRIYYPSNAEEYWDFTRNYRLNVRALPFDSRSVVIRSLSPHRVRLGRVNRWHPHTPGRYWHYVVQAGLPFQEQLADPRFGAIDAWKPLRTRTAIADLSLIAVPERR